MPLAAMIAFSIHSVRPHPSLAGTDLNAGGYAFIFLTLTIVCSCSDRAQCYSIGRVRFVIVAHAVSGRKMKA